MNQIFFKIEFVHLKLGNINVLNVLVLILATHLLRYDLFLFILCTFVHTYINNTGGATDQENEIHIQINIREDYKKCKEMTLCKNEKRGGM